MDEDYYDMFEFDYEYDEGSDRDNYEDEQVFQDFARDYAEEEDDDDWETFFPDPHEDSSNLDLSRGCD